MLGSVPGSQNDPLFSICRQGCWPLLTDSIVRKHLTHIIRMLGWEHKHITFHTESLGPLGPSNMGSPLRLLKSKVHGNQIAYGDIFIQPLKAILILSYKLFDYTYPIDGCLGECCYILLSCLLLMNLVSKKIQGKFPLGHFRGVTSSQIHYISISPKNELPTRG